MRHYQPHICRFLLSHRADVDAFSYDDSHDKMIPILIAQGISDQEANSEELARVNECQVLLLDAGADPTEYTDYSGSAFSGTCSADPIVSQWEESYQTLLRTFQNSKY